MVDMVNNPSYVFHFPMVGYSLSIIKEKGTYVVSHNVDFAVLAGTISESIDTETYKFFKDKVTEMLTACWNTCKKLKDWAFDFFEYCWKKFKLCINTIIEFIKTCWKKFKMCVNYVVDCVKTIIKRINEYCSNLIKN